MVFGEKEECPNEYLFPNLRHARQWMETWRDDYNRHRPRSSLNGQSPASITPGRKRPNPEQSQPIDEDC
ncbi:integrase core domain-containing protein [Stappia sp.]|uniref:integrase core domain-containing protein n=1 Tax=Stappia sp. TaxID=1870903 RepID=UPI003A992DED